MFVVPSKPTSLAAAIDKRREELGLLLRELADRAGISDQTILAIRDRTAPPSTRQVKAERKLEAALGWTDGSLQAIREGGDPTPLADDDLEERILSDGALNDDDKATLLHLYRTMRDKNRRN